MGAFPWNSNLHPDGSLTPAFHDTVARLHDDGNVGFDNRWLLRDEAGQAIVDGRHFFTVVEDEANTDGGRARLVCEFQRDSHSAFHVAGTESVQPSTVEPVRHVARRRDRIEVSRDDDAWCKALRLSDDRVPRAMDG